LKKIAVLISGRGSNFKAIKKSIDEGYIKDACISVVISDKENAAGLEFARESGLDARYINPKEFDGRENYDRELVRVLDELEIDLVCLAGFMRIISGYFVENYRNRIINIHPSLLPSFAGLDVQQRAIDHGVKFSGCTVHFVDEKMDNGPIIIQAVVPVLDDDTDETLSARILVEEHKIYPEAVRLFTEDRLKVEGRRVLQV